ncbi:MAG: hypothetical protein J7M30_12825 [Deltaproteobacteria bacterium]|nr:hypothetical protein [Deltaproteobacteria bacterium]
MEKASTIFMLTSVVLASFSTILALAILYKRRYMIIKPTFLVGLLLLVRSWSTVANINEVYTFLPHPWHYICVIPLFNVILLLISTFSVNQTTKEVWDAATSVQAYRYLALKRLVPIGLLLTAVCLLIYFLYVPPWQTGLWVAIKHGDPLMSREAREGSLKLLPAIPRYVFAFNREVVTRFLAAVLAMIMVAKWNVFRKRVFVAIPLLLLLLATSASIYGARGPGGFVIAAFILAWLLYKKMPINPIYIGAGFIFIILGPTVISAVRHGGGVSLESLWDEFSTTVFNRVFNVSTQVGIWHMDFVQRYGYWGVSGISKLAPLFGVQPVIVDNLIMSEYFKQTNTGLATVNSFITNYANFGLFVGMTLSIVTVWMLDLIMILYRRFTPVMLLPSICFFFFVANGVISSNFETLLITRGLIPGVILLLFLNKVVRNSEYQLEYQLENNYDEVFYSPILMDDEHRND